MNTKVLSELGQGWRLANEVILPGKKPFRDLMLHLLKRPLTEIHGHELYTIADVFLGFSVSTFS